MNSMAKKKQAPVNPFPPATAAPAPVATAPTPTPAPAPAPVAEAPAENPFANQLKEAAGAAAGAVASAALPGPVAEIVKRRVVKTKRVEKRVHMGLDLLTITVTIHVKGPDQDAIALGLENEASKLVRNCFGG